MAVMILIFLLMVVSFCVSLATSLLILYLGWCVGPRFRKDAVFCFLLIVSGVSLWVVVLLLLFDPMVGTGADFVLWLVYSALVGATPLAAFPGFFLYVSGKR